MSLKIDFIFYLKIFTYLDGTDIEFSVSNFKLPNS